MIPYSTSDLWAISPMLAIVITAMTVLMIDLALPRDRKSLLVFVSFLGAIISGACIASLWDKGVTGFNGTVVADDFALLLQGILLVVIVISVALSERYIQTKGINYGEYYALMLFSASGAMLMATSRELITIFVGLEVLSIALYVLSGFARTEARSEESAMKYFLLGAFSSGFFLYGIALTYGGMHTTRLDEMVTNFRSVPAAVNLTYAVAGASLLIVGLGFKAAIVPFHSWTPDVYEGAPTSVTAFMSAGAKVGAFAAFIRIIVTLLPIFHMLEPVLWLLAVLTMIVGNVIALKQTNIKRMLAYSSIAHAGYILVGLIANNADGHAAIMFYVLTYTFMNLGAFGIIIMLARRGQEVNNISDLYGLGERHPGVAVLMTIFMLSLAGIPPAAGFIGKFFLFYAAVEAHQYALAVIGLLASVVGVVYYLYVIIGMWFRPASREYPANVWGFGPLADAAVVISAIATLGLGVFFSGLHLISEKGAASLDAPIVRMAGLPNAVPVQAVPVHASTLASVR